MTPNIPNEPGDLCRDSRFRVHSVNTIPHNHLKCNVDHEHKREIRTRDVNRTKSRLCRALLQLRLPLRREHLHSAEVDGGRPHTLSDATNDTDSPAIEEQL